MPSPYLNEEQAKRQVEASLGNKFAVGLKTDASKENAFKSYCEHLASGRASRSWYYSDKEKNHCCYKTMENMIKKKEFPSHIIEKAKSAQYDWWEELGIKLCTGKCKGNTTSYITFMRNMFDWDKKEDKDAGTKELALTITRFVEASLPRTQSKSEIEECPAVEEIV